MLFGYVSVFYTAFCPPSLEQGSPGCCMLYDQKKKKKKKKGKRRGKERGEIPKLNVKKKKKSGKLHSQRNTGGQFLVGPRREFLNPPSRPLPASFRTHRRSPPRPAACTWRPDCPVFSPPSSPLAAHLSPRCHRGVY